MSKSHWLGLTASLAAALVALPACSSGGADGAADGGSDAGIGNGGLGEGAVAIYSSGTQIRFGARPAGSLCIDSPALALRFHDRGLGTYVADPAHQACPEPDGGTMLCDFGLEATLGTTPGTGTLKITEKPSGVWGDFEGEVDLAFPSDAGQRRYAFDFVAPVCGIE